MQDPTQVSFFVRKWLGRGLLLFIAFPFLSYAATFSYEIARTHEERTWGLMQREALPANHGMLFLFPTAESRSFWSFNCLIDLDVAFISSQWKILGIQRLKAFPERMAAFPPLRSYKDLLNVDWADPQIHFFSNHAIQSPSHTQYVLEMAAGWFSIHHIRIGDTVRVDLALQQGEIIHSQETSPSL